MNENGSFNIKQLILGTLLALCVILTMTFGVWVSQKVQVELGYDKPFLLTWIRSNGLLGLGFIHVIGILIAERKRKIRNVALHDTGLDSIFSKDSSLDGEISDEVQVENEDTITIHPNADEDQTVRSHKIRDYFLPPKWSYTKFLIVSIYFCFIYFSTNLCFSLGISRTNIASTLALEQISTVLIYVGSIIFLKEILSISKCLTVVLCVGGVIMVAFSDEEAFHNSSHAWQGDILILISTLGTTTYMVSFKRVFKDSSPLVINHLLFSIGWINFFFNWIVPIVVHIADVETLSFPNIELIGWLVLDVSIALLFNILLNFGIRFTSPIFVKYASSLTIPMGFFISIVIQKHQWNWLRFSGASMISLGFISFLVRDSIPCKGWKRHV